MDITPQEFQLITILRSLERGESVSIKSMEGGKPGELLMIITKVTKEMVEVKPQ